MNAQYYIEKLNLTAHPEGGFFKEVYRSDETISKQSLPKRYSGDRNFSTSIYFLLRGKEFSAFHKIESDESWHFYAGTAMTLMMISEAGVYSEVIIGKNLENNEQLQFTIKRNTWFASKVNEENSFSLLGCTVAPGFDFADFVLAEKPILLNQFPQHEAIINSYCIR
jgi:predicted cupin superfamily sugar epimerase